MNWSTNLRDLSFRVEMATSCLKHMNSVLSAFPLRLISLAVCSCYSSTDLAWFGVLAGSARSSA